MEKKTIQRIFVGFIAALLIIAAYLFILGNRPSTESDRLLLCWVLILVIGGSQIPYIK